jgi:hypothetical protein
MRAKGQPIDHQIQHRQRGAAIKLGSDNYDTITRVRVAKFRPLADS